MKVLLFGSNQITLAVLSTLRSLHTVNLVGVVTAPKQFRISYSSTPVVNNNHADLVSASLQNRVPCHLALEGMRSHEVKEFVHRLEPDIVFVVGWHHMIPKSLTESKFVVGIHASLLPRYRGGAPLVWAMINGEIESGVTLFQFDETVDGGPIIDQKRFSIEADESIKDVMVKAEQASLSVTRRFFAELVSIQQIRSTRQDISCWPIWPQRTPADGFIDPMQEWSAERLRNFIRAQSSPYPGAFTLYEGREYSIWRVSQHRESISSCSDGIHMHDGKLCYRCSDGCLLIDDLTPRQK